MRIEKISSLIAVIVSIGVVVYQASVIKTDVQLASTNIANSKAEIRNIIDVSNTIKSNNIINNKNIIENSNNIEKYFEKNTVFESDIAISKKSIYQNKKTLKI